MESDTKMKDELTQKIGVLTRRETEARVIAPFVDSLIKAFGKEKVLLILEETVMTLARNQGCLLYTSPSPRDGHQSRMPSSA